MIFRNNFKNGKMIGKGLFLISTGANALLIYDGYINKDDNQILDNSLDIISDFGCSSLGGWQGILASIAFQNFLKPIIIEYLENSSTSGVLLYNPSIRNLNNPIDNTGVIIYEK